MCGYVLRAPDWEPADGCVGVLLVCTSAGGCMVNLLVQFKDVSVLFMVLEFCLFFQGLLFVVSGGFCSFVWRSGLGLKGSLQDQFDDEAHHAALPCHALLGGADLCACSFG